MQITLVNIVQLVFAAQACVYLLLTARQSRLRPFALLLLVFALHMFTNFVVDTDSVLFFPDVTFAFRFAYGPLIYLFVREVIKEQAGLTPVDGLHAIPFLVALPVASSHVIFDVLGVTSIALYFISVAVLVRRIHKGLDDIVTSLHASRLDWITRAFVAILLISAFDITHSIGGRYFPILQGQAFPIVSLTALVVLINWFSLKAIRYPDVFEGFTGTDLKLMNTQAGEFTKLDSQAEGEIDKAIECLISQQLFLKPQLKVADLAEATDLKERFLSRALYLRTGQRFNQYVNSLRIEEAKVRLSQGQGTPVNILALSYDVGFNSKSAFNQAFKAFTGQTPSEFRGRPK